MGTLVMSDTDDIQRLLAIMARLRDPQAGCPWDRKQSFRTLLPYTLEEAYEVAEAIEADDMASLRDELGDLLFQIVFYAQMGSERGAFDFDQVVAGICAKMIRRHPHVFAGVRFADEAALRAAWEQDKSAERETKGAAGLLAGIAKTLPALVRAEKLQRRAARVGFDWDSVAGVIAKVGEELDECQETLTIGTDPRRRQEEIGDLLFSCVNLARYLGVDAEQALRGANERFQQRFEWIERGLAERGEVPSPENRDTMDALWEMAKRALGG